MTQYKTCSKCGQNKPLDAFSKHNGQKTAKSGHRSTCKKCDVEYNKQYRARNRKQVNENKRRWAQENKKKIAKYDSVYREKNKEHIREYYTKWRAENLDHVQNYQKQYSEKNADRKKLLDKLWAQSNKDRVNAASRRYRQNNPEKVALIKKTQAIRHPDTIRNSQLRRRARIAENGVYLVTKKDISRIMRERCVYCGAPSEHIDHVIPIAKGGAHKVGNLVAACRSCNQRKSDKFLSFWKAGK